MQHMEGTFKNIFTANRFAIPHFLLTSSDKLSIVSSYNRHVISVKQRQPGSVENRQLTINAG